MLVHELRAPLAPILTAVQILGHKEASAAQREATQNIIGRHVGYMSNIVDHLLSASLVSVGAVTLKLEALPVKLLLDQAIELSHTAISTGGHSLSTADEGNAWVIADRTQAPLMLSNLVTNAAKYTPDGGQINVNVETDRTGVRIVVRDSGVGIAHADMDEIFQTFGQSQQPLHRTTGGLGLGLSLSRRLAQSHGGTLTARSDGKDKGSEFTLTLKRATPQRELTQVPLPATGPIKRLDILIIEDNQDMADALALYYQLLGHETRVAYRPSDALVMAVEQPPDVVLSDIGLPEIDGFTLTKRLRTIATLGHTIFIATTGYAGTSVARDALDAGFDAHFKKPVDLKALDRFLQLACAVSKPG